jgi:hypothetical protein
MCQPSGRSSIRVFIPSERRWSARAFGSRFLGKVPIWRNVRPFEHGKACDPVRDGPGLGGALGISYRLPAYQQEVRDCIHPPGSCGDWRVAAAVIG